MTKYREVLLGFWEEPSGKIVAVEAPAQSDGGIRKQLMPGSDDDRCFIIRCRIPARDQGTPDDGLPIAEEVKP